MAYGKPSRTRSNFGQFQRYATANITKRLRKAAENAQANIEQEIAEELEKTYKENVEKSYSPRHSGSYEHTGLFLESIHAVVEKDPGIGRDRVKIVFDEDVEYPPTYIQGEDGQLHERTVTVRDVYQFLTEGTKGGGYYVYGKNPDVRNVSYNYPTPAHLFEQHTKIQMKSFLNNLDIKKYIK